MTSDSCSFKREAERLETFSTWHVSFMDPTAMAKDGFYYTKLDDIVRCAFCGLSLCNWKVGDSVKADHRRESPACPFLCELPVGNVPLDGPPLRDDCPVFRKDSCGFSNMHMPPFSCPQQIVDHIHVRELSLRTSGAFCGPAFPEYSSPEARLASFKDWPSSAKQTPASLSEAGFYYNGKGDETVCFHCGGPLKHWEEDDLPWTQHAWWYPTCMYLLRAKGLNFVREMCREMAALSTTK